MGSGLFVTGTDTGCGKTEVTLGLMHKLQQQGECVLGMKPVASGADPTEQGLRNQDALRIQYQCSLERPYLEVNPFAYQAPIAPHLAARASDRPIRLDEIQQGYDHLQAISNRVIVEGVGGWHVPLGDDVTLADLVRSLDLPMIMVVGLHLGCINHALMTAECMLNSGVRFVGWVANQIDPTMQAVAENLATLQVWLTAPCLGVIPYLEKPTPETVAACLDDQLLAHIQ
ncbi:MAG: dethiobiotin synthase [Candidatus Thiodiazotropha sp. (ex Lucinoma aequizonata)]|nr:dethiobiotin synthase [Candidatus Thiodiazotropha sp. (ex Lucinoma aequizonata)]MCU7888441.1 dethiobiotin synthase [Candidatus Thiodiazotropha sp. (ex Lucinoma aequizonata)]MCU7895470.1 dethiobiotin synthase [Candidatus Thiodiazotropha sp. (ex Lucinoma aequizonata)]MCU7898043.1 dethiobiotin synthase [Candidatus Thiodiazotropha sp. (ex Lucinoma aequizonata)]MCU7901959.1 dethiobiotin synthase [Candidatus Thiodiazotropha sp. (ex Lucinoma aequizonata)]